MKKVSVIIGRFQIHKLHKGHLALIEEAKKISGFVLILIGVTSATGTDLNPISFEVRKRLFGDLPLNTSDILPLNDMISDTDWSNNVDNIIDKMGYEEATILGGRGNSLGCYSGKHKLHIIEAIGAYSSTSTRKEIAKEIIDCPNFRAGIIHHVENRHPIVYSTVDVALYNNKGELLMGKKGDKFMFIGGFVDPNDCRLIDAANRELKEETGIITRIKYYDSMKVSDPRYTNTKDSIMTHLFIGRYNKLPNQEEIVDKEFTEFRFIGKNEINLVQDCHKPIVADFFNSNRY